MGFLILGARLNQALLNIGAVQHEPVSFRSCLYLKILIGTVIPVATFQKIHALMYCITPEKTFTLAPNSGIGKLTQISPTD
jgi:hypothetical protein